MVSQLHHFHILPPPPSIAPLCPCLHLQMVSLLHLAEITEEGVTFQSPVDGSRMLLTPEQSIQIQNRLGESGWAHVEENVSFHNCVGLPGPSRAASWQGEQPVRADA